MWQRLKFIWKIIIRQENGWAFFHLTKEQQKEILTGGKPVDITILYFGLDERTVENIGQKLEVDRSAYLKMREAMQHFCNRVEKGEVRSVKTYAMFKEILDKSN